MESERSSALRLRSIEFLIHSAYEFRVTPIVKYTALSLFADRFYRSLPSAGKKFGTRNGKINWLLEPRESNLQLFALISLWISSKIHNSSPLRVKILKSFGDNMIEEQHFTTQDFSEAEIIFLKVLNFEIGTASVVFIYLEELLLQFKEVAKVGELVNMEACMDIMDLLYEKEETSILYSSPCSLAASTLVASYLITVPRQNWEFPILRWETMGKFPTQYSCMKLVEKTYFNFITPHKEEDIFELVRHILEHVLGSSSYENELPGIWDNDGT